MEGHDSPWLAGCGRDRRAISSPAIALPPGRHSRPRLGKSATTSETQQAKEEASGKRIFLYLAYPSNVAAIFVFECVFPNRTKQCTHFMWRGGGGATV